MGTATSSPRDKIPQNERQLKAQQSLATRYAKRAAYYRATLLLVSAVLWLST